MAAIKHSFPVKAPAKEVWEAVALPTGLDEWWTLRSEGVPEPGAVYTLYFGPEYHWKAAVTRCIESKLFELEMTEAEPDWKGSRVSVELSERDNGTTMVDFVHSGWAEESHHYKSSSFCWAMYLRIMKRFVEHGEHVDYSQRLSV